MNLRTFFSVLAVLAWSSEDVFANFNMAPTGQVVQFAIDGSNQGTSLCAATRTECLASVPINTAGSPLFTSGTPGIVGATQWGGGTLGAMANYGTSPGAVLVPGVNAFITNTPTVTANAGTNLNTSALALEGGGNLATIAGAIAASRMNANARVTGNAGGIMDFAGQNASSPANALLIGGQFNTSPTTISSGNSSPFQLDSAGRLIVNCSSGCGGGGGTSLADEATFTQGTTSLTPIGGIFSNAVANLTSGQAGAVQLTNDRMMFVNLGKIAGAAPSATNPLWAAGAQAASTTMQNGVTANGNGTTLTVTGYETALINVNCSVACSGGTTINFEGTDSTGTYFSIAAIPVAGTGASAGAVNSTTTSGQFWAPVAGLTTIRARVSGYSAGTITVTGTPVYGANSSISQIANALAAVANNADAVAAAAACCSPVASYTFGYNGSTWDRLQVDGSKNLKVAINAAISAGTNVVGFTSNDPCTQATKSGGVINLTASGQIITGTAAKKTYICALDIVSATAQNIALVEGTGTTCATNVFGLAGGTTAATGWNFAANGGLSKGSGAGTVYSPSADTNGTAANVCLLLSGTGQTSGQLAYVQQ